MKQTKRALRRHNREVHINRAIRIYQCIWGYQPASPNRGGYRLDGFTTLYHNEKTELESKYGITIETEIIYPNTWEEVMQVRRELAVKNYKNLKVCSCWACRNRRRAAEGLTIKELIFNNIVTESFNDIDPKLLKYVNTYV